MKRKHAEVIEVMDYAKHAYKAGGDCAINGANTTNCHFSYFATPELTKEWERGKRDAATGALKDCKVVGE